MKIRLRLLGSLDCAAQGSRQVVQCLSLTAAAARGAEAVILQKQLLLAQRMVVKMVVGFFDLCIQHIAESYPALHQQQLRLDLQVELPYMLFEAAYGAESK